MAFERADVPSMEIFGLEPYWCGDVEELNRALVFGYNLEKEGFLKTTSFDESGQIMFVEWTKYEIPLSKFIIAYPERIFEDYRKQVMEENKTNGD